MKKTMTLLFILILAIAACTPDTTVDEAAANANELTIGDKTYTVADLEALPASEATFNQITYRGVAITALLEDAGYSIDNLSSLKAVAADGYSANYAPAQIDKADVIVAYALTDGPMTEEDGIFRMVLPDEEGNVNVRMLVELEVTE